MRVWHSSIRVSLIGLCALLSACEPIASSVPKSSLGATGGLYQKSDLPPLAGTGEVQLTVLATNDIHGGVEPGKYRTTGEPIGGLAFWGGVIRSIRSAIESKGGRVLVLDAGDQFQGTLISNTNEGDLVFSAMDEIGYDAVVPGNHDYDFGPKGWLKDRPTSSDENPREVIEGLAAKVKFPLLSANTYFRDSLTDTKTGRVVDVASNSCTAPSGVSIDWKKARRPQFLKPYLIRDFGAMKVAIIGLDHPSTASMTTAVNVSDLCFRDAVGTYREIRDEIGDRADVFILVIHSANSPGKPELTQFVKAIRADKNPRLDLVVAGHTHMIQKEFVDGVPIIQSGSGGERFGRIDFTFDLATKKLVASKTEALSGVALLHQRCDDDAKKFCSVKPVVEGSTEGAVSYEQIPVEFNQRVLKLIADARAAIRNLSDQKLFVAKSPLKRDRVRESSLVDLLTDILRQASGADLSFLNTGGIRTDLPAGTVTYEQFFEVLPFGNRAVVAGPMRTRQVISLLQRSIQTCGDYGALMQSGLRVRFSRNCRGGGVDPNAQLLTVETVDGQLIFDQHQGGVVEDRAFNVATLDFLLDGGSGYTDFKGTPMIQDLDIAREAMVHQMLKSSDLLEVDGKLDQRWFEVRGPSRSDEE
ncbi:MAG: bifunctional metallophosphatase/5'-nucleotidase [Bdellovibrionales bacterium]|nr:bifunctional metallophosphatase/5'-nucleotidase [Bdellovibrionales bacterium]